MKERITLIGVFLAVSLWVCSTLVMTLSPKEALAAEPVTLKVYNPRGVQEINQFQAPRLDTLKGKTICELSATQWREDETFPIIREGLQKRFPDVKIIKYTEFPMGKYQIDIDKIGEIVKAKGCQAVIAGNCG